MILLFQLHHILSIIYTTFLNISLYNFIVDVIKKNPTAGAVSICPAVNAIPRANTISIMHITTSKFKKYSILRIICLAISKIIAIN